MRIPVHVAVANLVLAPVASFSYLESLGRQNSFPQSNAANDGSSSHTDHGTAGTQPNNHDNEIFNQVDTSPHTEKNVSRMGISSYLDAISAGSITNKLNNSSGIPIEHVPYNKKGKGFQSYLELMHRDIGVKRRGMPSYLESISRIESEGLGISSISPKRDSNFSFTPIPSTVPSKKGFVSQSVIASSMECTASERNSYCDGLDDVESANSEKRFGRGDGSSSELLVPVRQSAQYVSATLPVQSDFVSEMRGSKHNWAGTNMYLDSLLDFPRCSPTVQMNTSLCIESRASGKSDVSFQKTSKSRYSKLTFTIPGDNFAVLVKQLQEKGGTLRLTGPMDTLSFDK